MKRRKILLVTHNYPIESFERRNAGVFVHDFAKELVKKGISVWVFCPSSSTNKANIEGIPVFWFKWGNGKKSLRELKLWKPTDLLETTIFFVKGIRQSIKLAREIKPDFCISMWAVPSGVFTYIINKVLGIPYCVWVLGSDIYVYSRLPFLGQIVQRVLKGAKYLFSDGFELSRQVKNISGKNCLFLPSGTNFNMYINNNNQKNNKQTLTFIGRMEKEKGPDILLDALLQLSDKVYRDLKVNFLGDGSMLKALKEKVKSRGLSPYVTFYGNVNSKLKIVKVLKASDWLIIPSRSDSIPLVFSEGMKAGTPVVAASLYDLEYLIKKYKVGLTFRTGSSSDLAAVISNLPSRNQKDRFGENTKKVAKLFDLNSSVKNFLRITYG